MGHKHSKNSHSSSRSGPSSPRSGPSSPRSGASSPRSNQPSSKTSQQTKTETESHVPDPTPAATPAVTPAVTPAPASDPTPAPTLAPTPESTSDPAPSAPTPDDSAPADASPAASAPVEPLPESESSDTSDTPSPEAQKLIESLLTSSTYTGKGTLEKPRYNDWAGQLVKVVFLGPSGCGKTSIIERYTKKRFIDDVKVPVHELFRKSINQPEGEAPLDLTLVDTGNDQIHHKVRTLAYDGADVFVICFRHTRQDLDEIRYQWLPELIKTGSLLQKNLPFLLVGCQADTTSEQNPVNSEQCETFAREVKAHQYIETSAKEDRGCIEAIHAAISACTSLEFEDKI